MCWFVKQVIFRKIRIWLLWSKKRWITAIIHLTDCPSQNWTKARQRPAHRWVYPVLKLALPMTAAVWMATRIQRIAPLQLPSTRPTSALCLLVRQKASATTTTQLHGQTTTRIIIVPKMYDGFVTTVACGASDRPIDEVQTVLTTEILPPHLLVNYTCKIQTATILKKWAKCLSMLSREKIKFNYAIYCQRAPLMSIF